jgi:hypothetical protein
MVRALHIGLIAALLAWAAHAVSQTTREHVLGGRGFTASDRRDRHSDDHVRSAGFARCSQCRSNDRERWQGSSHSVQSAVDGRTESVDRDQLQADYFAGFILNKLGAPLADAQLAMAMVATDDASLTHPAKAKRVAEVRKGWEAPKMSVRTSYLL